jgi:hypothetical protein
VLGIASLFIAWASPAQQADDPLLVESRALADELGHRLIAALTEALGTSGPAAAITVCKDLAPQIASELSRRSGAKIARTSTRIRNPANVPEPWQTEVLADFVQAVERQPAAELEYFAREAAGTVRYMRPILAGGVCLVCHGAAISDEVEAALAEHYPHDRATGYAEGDVRGAFVVVWPETSD